MVEVIKDPKTKPKKICCCIYWLAKECVLKILRIKFWSKCMVSTWWALCGWWVQTERSSERKWRTVSAPWTHRKMGKEECFSDCILYELDIRYNHDFVNTWMFTCMFIKWITGKNMIWTCIKLSLCYVAGILEKELISLSIKDIETIKEVPDIVKKDLKASITDAKDTERFVIWLTAQRLPLNLIQRYEYQYACSAGMLWFYSNF